MQFDYIRLLKCNRLSIKGDEIIIRPKAKTQMVLGTNGSGKSSLIAIGFSPLPPEPADFEKGGLWEVHVFDCGHTYQLKAEYGDKNVYSFIKDGVELNDGHTISVQLQLVEQHLRYTRQLHEFLLGQVKFTAMSPQARRDWIARLSSADFTYAFAQFNRFRKGYSAAHEVCKFLKGRINEEQERLIDPEAATAMRENIKRIHDELNQLLRISRFEGESVDIQHVSATVDELNSIANRFLKSEYPEAPGEGTTWESLIAELDQRLSGLKALATERGERYADLEGKVEAIRKMLRISPDDLSKTIDGYKTELNGIPELGPMFEGIEMVRCPEVITMLRDAVAGLPSELIPQSEYTLIREKLIEQRDLHDRAKNKLDGIQQQLHLMRACDQVTCPACNHGFRPGVDAADMDRLHRQSQSGEEFLAKTVADLVKLEERVADATANWEAQRRLREIRAKYVGTYPSFFTYIDKCGGLELGRGLAEKLSIYEMKFKHHERRKRLMEQLAATEAALEQARKESEGFGKLEEDLQQAIAAYTEVHDRMKAENEHRRRLRAKQDAFNQFEVMHGAFSTKYDHLQKTIRAFLESELTLCVDEQIRKLQTTLAINETALSDNELIENIIADLRKQLAVKTVEEEAYKILADAMSPKSGLIAEQITQQIGSIITGMNQMIKRIWGYPMHVDFVVPESGDLTYKFPIHVDGRERSDVSKGSDSMLDIVNMAFVLTAYYSMGLNDYPLYLDEPGRTFDGVHKQNLIPLIKDLVDCGKFSQILVISHDIDSQVAFPNSETIIMDDRNIDYPHPYNEHVEIH